MNLKEPSLSSQSTQTTNSRQTERLQKAPKIQLIQLIPKPQNHNPSPYRLIQEKNKHILNFLKRKRKKRKKDCPTEK
jgi:hypothetical protein